jgi:hypothetical protein
MQCPVYCVHIVQCTYEQVCPRGWRCRCATTVSKVQTPWRGTGCTPATSTRPPGTLPPHSLNMLRIKPVPFSYQNLRASLKLTWESAVEFLKPLSILIGPPWTLNVYTVQNPRRRVVLKKTSQLRTRCTHFRRNPVCLLISLRQLFSRGWNISVDMVSTYAVVGIVTFKWNGVLHSSVSYLINSSFRSF